jgi:hypothetical protein
MLRLSVPGPGIDELWREAEWLYSMRLGKSALTTLSERLYIPLKLSIRYPEILVFLFHFFYTAIQFFPPKSHYSEVTIAEKSVAENPFKMRISIVCFALVAAVAATPFPWAKPQVTGAPVPVVSARPNATKTRSHNHHHHKEPTPSFKLGCECAQAIIPVDKLSASEVRVCTICDRGRV